MENPTRPLAPRFDARGRHLTRRDALKVMGAAGVTFLGADVLVACQPVATKKPTTAVIGQPLGFALDETFIDDQPNWSWKRAIYNGLTEYELGTQNPKPSLATSWQYSDGGRTLTVKLRQGVKFHTGRPFGPEDVIFTFKKAAELGGQLRSTAAKISDVAASGGDEVTFHLKEPITNLFDLFEIAPIIDKETFADVASGKQIVGTGAFIFESYEPGVSLTLKRNPNYWKQGRPYLSGLQFRVFNDVQAALTALRSGQIHMLVNVTPATLGTITGSSIQVIPLKTNDLAFYVGMNLKHPPFDNKLVRQAVAYAIDREKILQQVFQGHGRASSIPFHISNPAYDKGLAETYRYDPSKAKELLKRAGVGEPTVEYITYSGAIPVIESAQIVQFNLSQVGIRTELKLIDVADFVSRLVDAKLPMWSDVHAFGTMQPVTALIAPFPYRPAGNPANLDSDTYRQLINTVWTETDPAKARAVYRALGEFLVDQVFIADIVHTTGFVAVQSNFKDWTSDALDFMIYDDAQFT